MTPDRVLNIQFWSKWN